MLRRIIAALGLGGMVFLAGAFFLGRWIYRRFRPGADLRGSVVLVAGASRGLGLIMAREFAREGARVVICARDEERLERARRDVAAEGAEVLAIPCDIGDRQQVDRLIEQTTERFGPVDVLVNNAGILTFAPLPAMRVEDFDAAIDVMLRGPIYLTMAVLPEMRRRRSGRIVNITSIGGKFPSPHLLPYVTAKFGAAGFSEGLRAELARDGIEVTTVVPGFMRTGSHLNAMVGGRPRLEFTGLALGASLPLTSMDAERAARRIVSATRRGSAELTLTPQALLAARLHGLFPGLTASLLGQVNRILPDAGDGTAGEKQRGMDSHTAVSASFLTALGERAGRRYHQYPEA